ncbi:MAG: hypothetical protein U0930_07240 [Pirellulales bacterium]
MKKARVVKAVKIIASCFIAFHLVAVFAAPASVPPTSTLIDSTWSVCSPYLHATNLNNGYHFFAPEPGASTLVEFSGTAADGSIKHGVMPDKQRMRPRLLYHRYFMLTEFLGSNAFDEKNKQTIVRAFAKELMLTEELTQIQLTMVSHRPSNRQEILIGDDLTAEQTYERQNLGSFAWTDFPELKH